MKYFMVYNAATLHPQSIIISLALAAFQVFLIWTSDVLQAYL